MDYEKLSAYDLMETFILKARYPILTASFSINTVVLIYLALKIKPDIEVVSIDTGLLFKETYRFMEEVRSKFNINLKIIKPEISLKEQAELYGDNLWNSDPDKCCFLRKVKPLETFLETQSVDLWITGMRRDQSKTRSNLKKVEFHKLPSGRNIIKINPLADWSRKEVWGFVSKHGLMYNPLYDRGYTSFGCVPCTDLPMSSDERSGRWKGKSKTECGIHTFTEKIE
ncbi:phosphoadenylyl-sulfate reductase [Desulfurobacterium atlanticum]|uniref:Adenosine 5'-phosphosulfate reductase n=1 Tax=Desulfurobacterium atlanticum TaxID=240169 RepID=A0A238ZQI8_9BACT|nr:phosphoadenylyl-sulfate reductase [Desulfurobacterium atlanticum]SNR85667.1 phosphoadenylylsulfate reductase (thioredoxin) [Desulfurobacterium atlanticum]